MIVHKFIINLYIYNFFIVIINFQRLKILITDMFLLKQKVISNQKSSCYVEPVMDLHRKKWFSWFNNIVSMTEKYDCDSDVVSDKVLIHCFIIQVNI